MIPTTQQAEALHAVYCRLTKQELRWSMSCFYCWEHWLSRGYTEADLKLVTSHIWTKIKAGERKIEAFRFSRFIGDLDYFEEERALSQSALNMAQKRATQGVEDRNKAGVIRATGRTEPAPDRCKPVSAHVQKLIEKFHQEHP